MQGSSPRSLLHPLLQTVHKSSCSLPEVQHPSCLPSPVKDAKNFNEMIKKKSLHVIQYVTGYCCFN